MFVLTVSRPSSNMGPVGLKSRSLGQILENSCFHFRGHICDPVLIKLLMTVLVVFCVYVGLLNDSSDRVMCTCWSP